jgi:hypothetical protein
VERNAADRGGPVPQSENDLADAGGALAARAQVDQHAAAVQRRVGAVDSDRRRHACDIGVTENRRSERLLALGHRRERYTRRSLGDALDQAGVLHRKEPLRDHHIQENGQCQRHNRDQQRHGLAVEDPVQQPSIPTDGRGEPALRDAREQRGFFG